MDIQELINAGAMVNICFTPEQVEEFATTIVDKVLAAKTENKDENTYLGLAEASKMLDVTINTLWRWDKTGYLKATKVGRRKYYKLSDIKKILDGE